VSPFRRGLNHLLGWWLARIALGVVASAIQVGTAERDTPPIAAYIVLDTVSLGLTLWFAWSVFLFCRAFDPSPYRWTARGGSIATLAAAGLAALHGHALLALDSHRALLVSSPLVGEFDSFLVFVTWIGLLGLLSGRAVAGGRRELAGLCRIGLILMGASTLAGLVHAVLSMRRMYWLTHPDLHELRLAETLLDGKATLPLLASQATANGVGLAAFVALLVLLLRFRATGSRLDGPSVTPGPSEDIGTSNS